MKEILIEAVIDTIRLFPLLYLSYFVLDIIEKKSSTYQLNFLFLKKLGVLFGALLGCVPQCGFSVIAASLYAQRGITLGTLVACFISTSDEALPLLLSHPQEYKNLGWFIVIKVVIAIVAGYFIDFIVKQKINEDDDFEIEVEGICSCNGNSFYNALYKSVKTLFFVFVINFVLGCVIEFIGIESIQTVFNVHPIFQPLMASLIGFIPNCAISILLVELYLMGAIGFGSMIAGLCTGAGVGLAVLFKMNHSLKENVQIVFYLLLVATISGGLINMYF